MKRILILCRDYPPSNTIGAVRPSKFAKYLNTLGYQVTVVVSPLDPVEPTPEFLAAERKLGATVVRLPINRIAAREKRSQLSSGLRVGLLKKTVARIERLREEGLAARLAVEYIEREIPVTFDVVIGSYGLGNYFGTSVGRIYKRRHPDTKFIADFRDYVKYSGNNPLIQGMLKGYFNRIARSADVVCAVAQGLLDYHVGGGCKAVCRVLTNGFDPDDAAVKKTNPNERFTLTYTGRLYDRSRLNPLFKALRELIDNGEMAKDSVAFNYAGNSFAYLTAQADCFGLTDILADFGRIPRERALQMQADADALVLSSWNYPGETDMVSGKIYEYMLAAKPILCLVSGTLPDSLLKHMLTEGRLGVCCEEAALGGDYPALRDYLLGLYRDWRQNGRCSFSPDRAYVERFSHVCIAAQLSEIIEE